jgi:hypothetical protein
MHRCLLVRLRNAISFSGSRIYSLRSWMRAPDVTTTAWRAMRGTAPSVVDGTANSILAAVSSRVMSRRLGLRTAERMMRRMV